MEALNKMKNINFWVALFALVVVWSCEEKENMDPLGNWELNTPIPSTPVDNASIVLDENAPEAEVSFAWTPAMTTNRFGVAYTFMLVPEGADDFENPLMTITPGNAGRELFVAPT